MPGRSNQTKQSNLSNQTVPQSTHVPINNTFNLAQTQMEDKTIGITSYLKRKEPALLCPHKGQSRSWCRL